MQVILTSQHEVLLVFKDEGEATRALETNPVLSGYKLCCANGYMNAINLGVAEYGDRTNKR